VVELGAQDAAGRAVDVVPRRPARGQVGAEVLPPLLLERLLDVEPGAQRPAGVAQPPDEVRDGDAAEAPPAAQHPLQELLVLPGPLAVDRVVRGHDAQHALVHHPAEVRQVHLVQGLVVGADVDGEAGVLHRVERVVLDHGHRVDLHGAGQGGPELPEQDRVLAVGLLHPSPGRVPRQVDADAAEEVGALRAQLEADRRADPLLEPHVPGGTPGHRHREGGRMAHHHTPGAVGEEQAGNPQPRDPPHRVRRPVVAVAQHVGQALPERKVAVEQAEPLVGGQLAQQVVSRRVRCPAGPHSGHGGSEGGRAVRCRHDEDAPRSGAAAGVFAQAGPARADPLKVTADSGG
jgi:hypothetical protein